MANIVRAALLQTDWPGTKEGMLDKHEQAVHDAKAQGAQVMCFQELFYGPYFCQVQDKQFYEYAEAIPGPTTERFQALAKELGMVMVLPMYEQEQPGILYNTAAVVDADGTFDVALAACVFHHIPHAEHGALLGELRRVLKDDGMLLVFEHNPLNPLTRQAVNTCIFDEHAVLIGAAGMRGRALAAGFATADVRYRIFFPHWARRLRPTEKWLTWLPLGAQYYVLARKALGA